LDSGSFPTIPNAFRQRPFSSIITPSASELNVVGILLSLRYGAAKPIFMDGLYLKGENNGKTFVGTFG
jgi:hypothetical protein